MAITKELHRALTASQRTAARSSVRARYLAQAQAITTRLQPHLTTIASASGYTKAVNSAIKAIAREVPQLQRLMAEVTEFLAIFKQ